jgi:hypothetical protein
MQAGDKKKYRAQYLIYRSKTKEDYTLLQSEILFVFSSEQKYFSKSEYVDNYIFFIFEGKILAVVRQKSILQSTKYLFGYALTE